MYLMVNQGRKRPPEAMVDRGIFNATPITGSIEDAFIRKGILMEKVFRYRGFELTDAEKKPASAPAERMYRGVRYVRTERKIISPETGVVKLIYRAIIAA